MKLAISYALAQSTKLSVYEKRVTDIVLETKHLPEALAEHGAVEISGHDIAKLIGKVRGWRGGVGQGARRRRGLVQARADWPAHSKRFGVGSCALQPPATHTHTHTHTHVLRHPGGLPAPPACRFSCKRALSTC